MGGSNEGGRDDRRTGVGGGAAGALLDQLLFLGGGTGRGERLLRCDVRAASAAHGAWRYAEDGGQGHWTQQRRSQGRPGQPPVHHARARAKGNRIHVPLALLRAVRGGAARSQGRRPSRSWRRRYIVIDNKIKLPPPPPKPSPRAPLRILHAATSQRLKPSLRLKPPPPHAVDLDEVVPSVTEEEEKEQRAETKDVDNLMALFDS